MIPYLYDERKNRAYEITANYRLKREYEKQHQRKMREETLKVLTPSEYKMFMDKDNISQEQEFELSTKLMINMDVEEINRKLNREFIIKLIVSKYNDVTNQDVEELLSNLEEEYGEEQVEIRLGEIIEKVFTQVGVAQVKAMPMWGMEE